VGFDIRVLVIGSCGKRKKFSPHSAPTCQDLKGKESLSKWRKKFPEMNCEARSMYTGNQSRELVGAVDMLRTVGNLEVHLFIISAGFGILKEDEIISPYECSFTGMKKAEIRERASLLSIDSDFSNICKTRYDFSYLALGSTYLTTLKDSWTDELSGSIIAFGSTIQNDRVLNLPANADTVQTFSSTGHKIHGVAGFKGDLLRILVTYALNSNNPYREIASWTNLESLLETFRQLAGWP